MTNAELKASLEAALNANKQLASQFQQQQAAFEELKNSVTSTKPAKPSTKPAEEQHSIVVLDLPNYRVLASRELGSSERIIVDAAAKKGLSFIHGGLLLTNLNSFTAKKEDSTIRYNRTSRGYFAKAS